MVPSHLVILDHFSSRPLPFEGESPATQVGLVRRNTPDVERRAARILDRALHPAQGLMPSLSTVEATGRHGLAEAIVLAALRPAFFLTDDTIDTADAVETDPLLLDLVTRNAALLIRTAAGVGRVDLILHATLPNAGTGFLIDETLAVTNRHVALVFAERLRTGFGMRAGRFGTAMKARLVYHGFARRTSRSRA